MRGGARNQYALAVVMQKEPRSTKRSRKKAADCQITERGRMLLSFFILWVGSDAAAAREIDPWE